MTELVCLDFGKTNFLDLESMEFLVSFDWTELNGTYAAATRVTTAAKDWSDQIQNGPRIRAWAATFTWFSIPTAFAATLVCEKLRLLCTELQGGGGAPTGSE